VGCEMHVFVGQYFFWAANGKAEGVSCANVSAAWILACTTTVEVNAGFP
jgi:hypothetical protein